jgi:7,8-dihydropterin-6-yl-methyl-4-(beta-D-ribofuranosyl)aminobenzene 5'-phosphate synthase
VKKNVVLTVLYDNTSNIPELTADWGFSCLIRYQDTVILFDTGATDTILQNNLLKCGINRESIQAVFLSHNHFDHAGGLSTALNGLSIPCFVPQAARRLLGTKITSLGGEARYITERELIAPHFWSTGQKKKWMITEHSLVIEKENELILITGCAHQGIVNIVEEVIQDFGRAPTWVIGGFHLYSSSKKTATNCANHLKNLGVVHVAPCHCTGEEAIEIFKDIWREGFEAPSVGWKRSL